MLMIRHAIGSRLFLQTDNYSIIYENKKWHIKAAFSKEEKQNLHDFKKELNIFIVEPNQKTWYYSSDADIYINDNEIEIVADHQTIYPV